MDLLIGISSETLTNSTYCQSPFMFSCENYFDYSLYENKHLALRTFSVFFFCFFSSLHFILMLYAQFKKNQYCFETSKKRRMLLGDRHELSNNHIDKVFFNYFWKQCLNSLQNIIFFFVSMEQRFRYMTLANFEIDSF